VDADRRHTPYRLLTRHFLRQFLENDLISPEADRTQLLAVVGAMVLCLTMFISVSVSANYVMVILMPGQLAVTSLDDKFFYLSLGMITTALLAASQWDNLAIDPRDVSILEPLPVRAGTIRRAKLSAVAILGATVAVGVSVFPSVVFPWLLVYNLRQLSLISLFGIMATHAVVAVAASAFGYLVVIALREVLAATLGPRWFTRVSPLVQGVLIVVLGSALLLLPAAANRVAERGFQGWRAMAPPTWFLGVYEVAAGHVMADLPRRVMTPRQAAGDQVASALYRERRDQFPAMARRAQLAVGLTLIVAIVAYLWQARRLPALAPGPPPSRRRHWRLGGWIVSALLAHHPAMRAGFAFTLAAMWRSNTHRLTLACAAAAGCAMAILSLSGATVEAGGGASARLLAMQPLLFGALLVGFRHVIRVPAELRANWGFQLAWRGRDRAFVTGAKGAALMALVLPALAALLPLYAFVLGPRQALVHAALGLAGAIVFLEALLLQYDKVPFTCTYVPNENAKALVPIYTVVFFMAVSAFARMQHEALQGGVVRVLITLAVVFGVLRLMSATRPRLPLDFDEAPVTFQRLGLGP